MGQARDHSSVATNRRPAIQLDLGDITLDLNLRVKGLRPPRITWRIGPFADTVPADRVPGPRPPYKQPRKVDFTVQLPADMKVSLASQASATDEVGNPTPVDPADFSYVYTVDDPSLINLTDNGDGTAVAAATGAPGPAVVTSTVTHVPSGRTGTDSLALEVVPGGAEVFSVAISAGAPEEITPDV